MCRINHEAWIVVPFWFAWLTSFVLFSFVALIVEIILEQIIGGPTAVVVAFVLLLVLSFIYTVLTRRAHEHWLKTRTEISTARTEEVER